MADVTAPPGLPLWSDYPRFVRRHRAVLLGLAAVGLLAGYLWSLGQPTTYSATASAVLTAVPKYVTPPTVGLAPPAVTIDTDAQLLRSPEVLEAVAEELGVGLDAAGEHLSVTASPQTSVLHVTVSASSPLAAADAADAAVAALAEVRRRALGALASDQLARLRLLVNAQEQALAAEQGQAVVIAPYDALTAEIVELRGGLAGLDEAREQPVEPLVPAVLPTRPDYPNTEVPLTSGAMVGLLFGCLVGALQDRTGRRRAVVTGTAAPPSLITAATTAATTAPPTAPSSPPTSPAPWPATDRRPRTRPTTTDEDRHHVT